MSYDLLINDAADDIEVTPNGDLVLATTKVALTKQWLKSDLRLMEGEWFLNILEGTDWPSILSNRNNQRLVDITVKTIIANSKYVDDILAYNSTFNRSTMKYSLDIVIQIESGEIVRIQDLEV